MTEVPERPHSPDIAKAGVLRRFVVRTTAWTHSPGVTLLDESQSSTRTPCLVVEASGRPFGWRAAGSGTSDERGRTGPEVGMTAGLGEGEGSGDGDCARAAASGAGDGRSVGSCAAAMIGTASITTMETTAARRNTRDMDRPLLGCGTRLGGGVSRMPTFISLMSELTRSRCPSGSSASVRPGRRP